MKKDRIPVRLIADSFLGRLDAGQKNELDEWLSRPGNTYKYNSLKDFWNQTRADVSGYVPDGDRLWNRLQREIIRKQETDRKFTGLRVAVAAAVVLLMITGTALIVGTSRHANTEYLVSVESVSGKSKALLPDGTVVWLNGKSAIGYDRHSFGKKERKVSLSGEAFFEVTKDMEKPFRVISNDLTVTVTGTKFNVENTEDAVNVSLLEGGVDLSLADGQNISLLPGQKGCYDKEGRKLSLIGGSAVNDACWARESLVFVGKPLGEICKYLSVWYGVDIRPEAGLKDSYAYSFTVTDEPLEQILKIMADINPLTYAIAPDGGYVISPAKK